MTMGTKKSLRKKKLEVSDYSVRAVPPSLVFNNLSEGVYTGQIMIQNTGKLCSRVALKPFEADSFTVTLRNKGAPPEQKIHKLAPGMSVWLDVEATYKNGDEASQAVAQVVIIRTAQCWT